jgi:hypothetical protein
MDDLCLIVLDAVDGIGIAFTVFGGKDKWQ